MRKVLVLAVAAGLMSAVSMTPLAAGIFGSRGCCNPCSHCQVNPCACGAPMPAPLPVLQPQAIMPSQTIMQPQTVTVPQTSYRDVVRTEYRTQAELQQVPVTRYKQVAADEGSWQQVWVPRVVQKQVPETVMEQRTVYRTVPHQVTQRVPETTYTTQTQWVPRVVQAPVTMGVVAQSSCLPTAAIPPVMGWNATTPSLIANQGVPMSYGPVIGAIPTATVPTLARDQSSEPQPLRSAANQPLNSLSPVPDAKFLDTPVAASSDWSPVRAEPRASRPIRTSSAAGMFVPVPSRSSATRLR